MSDVNETGMSDTARVAQALEKLAAAVTDHVAETKRAHFQLLNFMTERDSGNAMLVQLQIDQLTRELAPVEKSSTVETFKKRLTEMQNNLRRALSAD